jgi:hypothetical protein
MFYRCYNNVLLNTGDAMSIEAMKWAIEVFLDRYSTADQVAGVIGALRHAIEQEEKREWVGLTDDEVESWRGSYDFFDSSLVRKVEAKLKEKNSV